MNLRSIFSSWQDIPLLFCVFLLVLLLLDAIGVL